MKNIVLFFGLSERERKGSLFFLLLIVIVLLMPRIYQFYIGESRSEAAIVSVTFRESLVVDEKAYKDNESQSVYRQHLFDDDKPKHRSKIFPFNPNNLPKEIWRELGFSDRQIQVIKNYEAKGGRFRSANDLAKIYSISTQDMERLKPYLRFEAGSSKANFKTKETEAPLVKTINRLEINKADSAELENLKGIGPILASRIVKFRSRLGGFHHVNQIQEVYGVSDELFAALKGNFVDTENEVKKMNINTLTEEELASHPYISKKIARILVRYREQHGGFRSIADLRLIYALDVEFLHKIEPYLQFD
ncbi:helix-hairpin-helix domain-containing protein [Sphingobacterium suaedae]|uniref:Helix-hairpin-helix domain-containing protein n=1 Tax=Sphingobacterium suaedae TaxID=1686402 RepID=A0ABW5KB41_9SPHI